MVHMLDSNAQEASGLITAVVLVVGSDDRSTI